jgi:hypothetical protein
MSGLAAGKYGVEPILTAKHMVIETSGGAVFIPQRQTAIEAQLLKGESLIEGRLMP